jgi:hypothetical protein
MRSIANVTGGNFWFPDDAEKLPSIFIKEAKTLKRSMIQNKSFVPEQVFPSPILKGIASLPPLGGYVLTTPKPRSTTILKGPEEEDVDPVLATWRFGVGKTAAWTSDLAPNWAAAWVTWDQYAAFVKQFVTDIARVSQAADLRSHSFAYGNRGVVVVEDYAAETRFLNVTAQVRGPQDRQMTVPLRQVAPRRYEARFELWGEGRYQAMAIASGGKESERVHTGFVVPYSQEYLRFRANPILLRQVAERTGGRILRGDETAEQVYQVYRQPRRHSQPIFDWFLIVLACLVPLDVAFRRVHLDMQVIRHWLGMTRTVMPSDETFDALLRRKKSVSTTLKQRDGASVQDVPPPDLPPLEPPPPSRAQPAAPPLPGDTSTTERLLALKRRRRDDEHDSHTGSEP